MTLYFNPDLKRSTDRGLRFIKKAVAKESGYEGQAGENPSSSDIVTEDMGPEGADRSSSFGNRIAQLQRLWKKHEFWVEVLLAAK